MNNDVSNYIKSCTICAKIRKIKKQKEKKQKQLYLMGQKIVIYQIYGLYQMIYQIIQGINILWK